MNQTVTRLIVLSILGLPLAGWGDQVKLAEPRPGEHLAPPAFSEQQPDKLTLNQVAPDFTLKDPSGKTTVQLSKYLGKRPLVLIFGSYTCPAFRGESENFNPMFEAYKNRADFLGIYIREAHPGSVVFVTENGKETLMKIGQTQTLAERSRRASQAVESLGIKFPLVVDDKNQANAPYAGWPVRYVIITPDGKIAFKTQGPGPFGFITGRVTAWLDANT